MKLWFQRKKPELKPATGTDSTSNSSMGQHDVDITGLRKPPLFGEQLIMIRRHWEQFQGYRDAIPGIVQITAHGFETIADMIGVMLSDSTVYFVFYADTPTHPNTMLVRGKSIGDIHASLSKEGVVFNYRGAEYYTAANYPVMKTLEVLDYFWPNQAFTFVYGEYGVAPTLIRKDYYLSGPKSIPQGKNAFLVSTSRQSDSDPTTVEIELQWDNGETYSTRLQSGVNKLEITRVK